MIALVSGVGAYASLGILLASGLSHLRHPGAFREALKEQGIWSPIEGVVIGAVTSLELAIGLAGLLALTGALAPFFISLACLLAFSIYLSYAVFSIYLVSRRPGVPCGCGSEHEPVNVWTVIRAGLLAMAAIGGTLGSGQLKPLAAGGVEAILPLLAGSALALLAWALPTAMTEPHRPSLRSHSSSSFVAYREAT